MFYEVYLNASTGKWRIRLGYIVLYFFSRCEVLMRADGGPEAVPVEFDRYDAAVSHVRALGIDKVYAERKRKDEYPTLVHTEGCHAQG